MLTREAFEQTGYQQFITFEHFEAECVNNYERIKKILEADCLDIDNVEPQNLITAATLYGLGLGFNIMSKVFLNLTKDIDNDS